MLPDAPKSEPPYPPLSASRLRNAEHPLYEAAKQLYESSFPREERRSDPQHRRALADEAFHSLALSDERGLAAILYYWQHPDFTFIEHLAVCPERRGCGIGHRVLRMAAEQLSPDRPVILEIEPAVDERTRRRLRFYESCGYRRLPDYHEQQPYHAGLEPLPMELLLLPQGGACRRPDAFEDYLLTRVMQYRDR